jgi:hypothetical protein
MTEDLAHLEQRLRQSREMAETSDDISVRAIHQQMAEQYEARIAAAKTVK